MSTIQQTFARLLTILLLFISTLTLVSPAHAEPMPNVNADDPFCLTVTEIPQIECNALVALYNSTNGPSWTNHTNWLQTSTPSNWYGIGVWNGHVTNFGAYKNNLSGSLPPELGNLTQMTYLSLHLNNLSGPIPSELGNLTNLKELRLSQNQFSGPIPPALGSLSQLTLLWLGYNPLTGSIPTEMCNLTQLTQLYLGFTNLSGSIPSCFGNLTKLNTLDLSYNSQLGGSIPTTIGNMISLTNLNLSYSQLSGSIPTTIGDLTSLTYLYLQNNQLTGSIPAEMGNLISLKNIDLSNNQLTGSIPVEVGKLTSLQFLSFSLNQLNGNIPSSVWNLTSLQILKLSFNQLDGTISDQVGNLTLLQKLRLEGNHFTGCIPATIGELHNLTELGLNYNALSCDIPDTLWTLNKLTELGLNYNQFTGDLSSPTIGQATSLVHVAIDQNLMAGDINREILKWTTLYGLYLDCTLTTSDPDVFDFISQESPSWASCPNHALITRTPTPTTTPTHSQTNTATPTITPSITPTITKTNSRTPTPTGSITKTNTLTPTKTGSKPRTPTCTPIKIGLKSRTPTRTSTLTPTKTGSKSRTPTKVVETLFCSSLPVTLPSLRPFKPVDGAAVSAYTVNSLADTVDILPGNNACRDASGKCSLRAAVMEANKHPGNDKIILPAGTYNMTLAGTGEENAVKGDYDILESVIIESTAPNGVVAPVTIDAKGLDRVFHVLHGTLNIHDLTIRNGVFAQDGGGNIFVSVGANLIASNLSVQNGKALSGGGIYFYQSSGTLNNVVLNNNESLGWAGGGMVADNSTVQINDSHITNNKANWLGFWPRGAGMHIAPGSKVTILRSIIAYNVTRVNGGGIYNDGTLVIKDSLIFKNKAGNAAGALIVDNGGTADISNSTITCNEGHEFGNITLDAGSLKITNSTIAYNSAAYGAGVTSGVQVGNSIIYGNRNTNNQPNDCSGTLNSLGYNLIGTPCTISGVTTGNRLGVNPRLGTLGNYGGYTLTFPLLTGSPAIDTASNAMCPNHDQRGVARPMGTTCDMGAYEVYK